MSKGLKINIFRISVLAAFLTGLFYFLCFCYSSGLAEKNAGDEAFMKSVALYSSVYWIYLVCTVLAFVMNFICFNYSGKVVSVIRTFFLALSLIGVSLPVKVMSFFSKACRIDYDDTDEVDEILDTFGNIDVILGEEQLMFIICSFAVILFLFVLAVTSVAALVKNNRNNN